MIKALFYRNKEGKICGFSIEQHGDPIVCAAVSALTFNAVNSLEELTEDSFSLEEDDKAGRITLMLPDLEKGEHSHDANLLLESFYLGIATIEKEYSKHLCMNDKEV